MTAATDSADTYTVKSGDTLSKIATAHHTTVKELQKLNNLSTTQIKVGQHLKMPHAAVGAPASGSTAAPPPAPVP
jgi:peptidoglycan DL-endopeptidase LytE